jgi:hypothetical protein
MPKTVNKTQKPKDTNPLQNILNELIPLTMAQKERIGFVVGQDILNAVKDNADNYKLAARCDRMYEGIVPKKNFPWTGASNLWIPLSEWTTDAVYARVMASLFSHTPYVKAEGRTQVSANNAEAVTEILDYVFTEVMDLKEKCKTIFKEAIKKPKSTCKLIWKRVTEKCRRLEVGIKLKIPDGTEKDVPIEEAEELIKAGAQMVSPQPIKLTTNKPYELYNGASLEYVPYPYYIAPANSVLGQKPRFEAHVTPMRWNDVLAMLNDKKFYPDSVKKLKETAEIATTPTSSEDDIRKKSLKGRDYLFEVAEYHGLYAFDNQEHETVSSEQDRTMNISQEAVFWVELNSKILLGAKYPLTKPKLDRRVFYNTRYETVSNRFEGRGVQQKLENLNRATNSYYNNFINNAMMSMTKLFKRKRGVDDMNVDDPDIYPGAIVDVKEMTDFEAIDMGTLQKVGIDIIGMVLKFAERLTSVTAWGLGTQPGKAESGGKTTATEFKGIMGEANLNFSVTIENFVSTLVNICKDTVEYYYYNMPEGMERKIRGEGKKFVFPEKTAEEDKWSRDKLLGEFNFHWQITDDRGRSIERDIYIMNNFMNLPFMQKHLKKTWEMAKQVAISLGKKDWETVLPSEQEIDAEQGRIDQAVEAERLMAIQVQLAKKGYTPEEIEAAFKKFGMGGASVPATNRKIGRAGG